jgi:hypothetical protein
MSVKCTYVSRCMKHACMKHACMKHSSVRLSAWTYTRVFTFEGLVLHN